MQANTIVQIHHRMMHLQPYILFHPGLDLACRIQEVGHLWRSIQESYTTYQVHGTYTAYSEPISCVQFLYVGLIN
jgi:hypothetical protein